MNGSFDNKSFANKKSLIWRHFQILNKAKLIESDEEKEVANNFFFTEILKLSGTRTFTRYSSKVAVFTEPFIRNVRYFLYELVLRKKC